MFDVFESFPYEGQSSHVATSIYFGQHLPYAAISLMLSGIYIVHCCSCCCSFELRSLRPLEAGAEVCISYGENKCNAELLRDYGKADIRLMVLDA
jgi:hypothetical protein